MLFIPILGLVWGWRRKEENENILAIPGEQQVFAGKTEAIFMHCSYRGFEVTKTLLMAQIQLFSMRLKTACMPKRLLWSS